MIIIDNSCHVYTQLMANLIKLKHTIKGIGTTWKIKDWKIKDDLLHQAVFVWMHMIILDLLVIDLIYLISAIIILLVCKQYNLYSQAECIP